MYSFHFFDRWSPGRRIGVSGALICWLGLAGACQAAEIIKADVCIYGGTAGGVAAAVQAARMGKTAVLVEFGGHLGGMTSGGLGATDIGNKAAIGGIAREFYHLIAQHYAQEGAWRFEKPEAYFRTSNRQSALDPLKQPGATMWTFEPHVAEDVLFQLINTAGVPVFFQQRLQDVRKNGNLITELRMENGKVYQAAMFIDTTYEGDLMAKAGVSYTFGREANAVYKETLNGIRAQTPKHQFTVRVDPYRKAGDPVSGLLPFVQAAELGEAGAADRSVQAYNFRLCYTRNPANRLPHAPPANYNPARFELLARYLEALVDSGRQPQLEEFWNPIAMPNGKTDINNNGGFSTDFIGANSDYPEGNYAVRSRIWKENEDYIRGLVYFLATSPRVPDNMRLEMQSWGPAKDEFLDNDNWPRQLYVREARRMVSSYVMTEHNCRGEQTVPDAIGLAAYTMDSHNCRRLVRDGSAQNEGDVQVGGFPPYPIAYRSIVPETSQCGNLAVPVCLSASHIAYGSIRMEPVFMILGQSAATAASLALDERVALQHLRYGRLRSRLMADGQILSWPTGGQSAGARP